MPKSCYDNSFLVEDELLHRLVRKEAQRRVGRPQYLRDFLRRKGEFIDAAFEFVVDAREDLGEDVVEDTDLADLEVMIDGLVAKVTSRLSEET